MTCNELRIVLGNDFPTKMTIKAVDVTGKLVENFNLENSTDIVVKYIRAGVEHEISSYTISGNEIFIQWSDLPLGGYGFVISGILNGSAWRYAAKLLFRIVADQESANIPAGTIVDGVYVLDGWLSFLSDGSGGGAVRSVNGQTGNVVLDAEDVGAQETLVSGDNIKTVNGESLLGEGNIEIGGAVDSVNGQTGVVVLDYEDVGAASAAQGAKADTAIQDISGKQDVLVSGTNIKTINNESILGSGNITIEGGGDVESVNGQTGDVVLDAEDVGAASAEELQGVADDVATLQAAYAALTQSDIVIGALPASGETNTIYRVPNTNSYSDYMWNGTQFVLMATYTSPADGVYDISAEHSGATYDNLTAALGVDGANVPSAVRKGGMSVKYVENVYAEYSVVVTEGITTQPSGTELETAPSITDGTYKASQLTDFSTLPTYYGSSLTYYVVVSGDTTTYKQWVITKEKNNSVKYVQYRLDKTDFSTDITDWQKCVEDYDAILFKMTSGVRVARADGQLASDTATEASDFIDIRGYDKIFITTKLYNAFSTANDSVVFVYDINGVPRIILDPRDYSSQRQTQINIIGKEYVVQENDAYIRLTNYVGSNYANYTTPYVFVKKSVEYNTSKLKVKDVLNNPISTWHTAGTSGATNFRLFCPLIIAGLEDVRITLKLKDNSWRFVFVETMVLTNPNAAQAMYDSGWMRYVENYTPHTSAPILCIRVDASNKSSSSAINDWKDAISEFYIEYTNSAEKCSHELITLNASEILINERCKKIQTSLFPLNFEEVIGINHRGYNSVAPENTLPAYKLSAINGFKYVETDVRFTSDGVAVLLHDASINRTARNADGTSISGTVNIADITYEQALAYDFGIAKGTDYAGTKIPTLREFLLLCRNAKLQPFLELKAGTSSQIKQVVDIVGEYNMKGRVFYSSPEYIYLLYVAGYDKDASLSYVISTSITQDIIDNMLYLKNNGHYITISSNSQSSNDIELCKTNGIPYILWTIDNESTIINANPYICGFTSNSLNATKVLYDSAIE